MIDWARVANLRNEVGEEDFDEIVALFLEEVAEVTGRLAADPTPATLQADMHFLKGSAMSLGFSALSDLCQAAEVASGAGRAAEVDLPALLACYRESRDNFLQELKAGA